MKDKEAERIHASELMQPTRRVGKRISAPVTIVTSDWMRKWRDFFYASHVVLKYKTKTNAIHFDS